MNSSSTNSGQGSGVPAFACDIVSSDGSCSPASEIAIRLAMKQQRTAKTKAARQRAKEKALELQQNAEDRAAALSVLRELRYKPTEFDRQLRLKVRTPPKKPFADASPVRKRGWRGSTLARRRPHTPSPSSWLVDDGGERGITWQQSYIGRSSGGFYVGIARDKSDYDLRDEAVARDAASVPFHVTNMGDHWLEVGAGWQALEDASTRKNAKIMMRVVMPLDSEASLDEMQRSVTHFCETVLAPLGLPYSATIHEPAASEKADERNWHAHLSFSLKPMARVAPYTFDISNAVRSELDGRDAVQAFRHLWANSMTVAAEQAGRAMRYTGLSHAARGTGHEVGEHLGEARSDMVQRGVYVPADERNRQKAARNRARRTIRDLDRKIAAFEAIQIAAQAAEVRINRARPVRVDLTPGRKITARPEPLTVARAGERTPPLVSVGIAASQANSRPPLRAVRSNSAANEAKPALSIGDTTVGGASPRTPLVASAAATEVKPARRLVSAERHPPRRSPLSSPVSLNPFNELATRDDGGRRSTRLVHALRFESTPPVERLRTSDLGGPRKVHTPLTRMQAPTEPSPFLAQLSAWLKLIGEERLRRQRKARDAVISAVAAEAAARELKPTVSASVNPVGPSIGAASVALPTTAKVDVGLISETGGPDRSAAPPLRTAATTHPKLMPLAAFPDFATIQANKRRNDEIAKARLLFPGVVVQTDAGFDALRARRARSIGLDPAIDQWVAAIENRENETVRRPLARRVMASRTSRAAVAQLDPTLLERITTEAGASANTAREGPTLSR